MFATGLNKVPGNGLKTNIQVFIQKLPGRLPMSNACFSELFIPRESDIETFFEKMMKGLKEGKTFGKD